MQAYFADPCDGDVVDNIYVIGSRIALSWGGGTPSAVSSVSYGKDDNSKKDLLDFAVDIPELDVDDTEEFQCNSEGNGSVAAGTAFFSGNPIDVVRGIKLQWESDYKSGHRLPLRVNRLYRSDVTELALYGKGWSEASLPSLAHNAENVISIAVQGLVYAFYYDGTNASPLNSLEHGATLELLASEWSFVLPGRFRARFVAGSQSALSYGRVIQVSNVTGDTLSYSYSNTTTRLPYRVAHSSGSQLNYNYQTLNVSCTGSECNKVVTSISTDQGTWDYNYDNNGRLTEVISPTGVKTGYMYDSSHRLIGRTNDDGIRVRWWGYDSNGRANLSRKYGNEEEVTVTYSSFYSSEFGRTVNQAQVNDEHGRVTNVIYADDALGVPRILKNQAVGDSSCPSAVAEFTYEPDTGRLASELTNGGVLATYTYDVYGFPISRTETASDIDTTQVTRSFHSQVWGKLDSETLRFDGQDQHRVNYTYCTANNSTCKVGLPTAMTVTDLVNGGSRTTSWNYTVNGNGRVTKVEEISPTNVKLTMEYNDAGLITRQSLNNDVQLQVLSYGAAGLPTSVQYENLYKVNTAYNNDGQPTQASYQMLDGSSTLTTTYEYNNLGQLVNVVRPSSQTTTGESFDYDQNGRLITRSLGTWVDEEPPLPPPPLPGCNPWEPTCFNEL
ncbi:DUF6531 domain-containing protein [Umboniibacter marinipuniceus]|uniref:YD repeat-containing protein n=1 Tax=Umboniibacter marinipuniceus TaxID=569599 RepID=A0A3M0AHR9_9GAMM|nr:DUF6531 domain-containing protein [Umboniibacter marinipuniceus]RMA82308.1 YD repeat-containing protein [Umboniibacter marinipuniceus]